VERVGFDLRATHEVGGRLLGRIFVGGGFFVGLAQWAAESDASLVQVVWRDGDRDDVARKDAYEVLAHLACDVGDDLMPIVELDAELRIGKRLGDFALNKKGFFFGHRRGYLLRTESVAALLLR